MARNCTTGNYLKHASPADFSGAGSVFVRVKPNWSSGDGVAHTLWGHHKDGSNFLYYLKFSNNNIYLGWNNGGDQRIIIADTGIFSSGTWANHLYDWDETADLQHLYVDNTLQGTSSTAFSVYTSTATLTIGAASGGVIAEGDQTGDSHIAEWARWDHVLDSTERATLQSTGNPACLSTGLVHHYKILGNDSPEPDEVGTEDLTVTGSPAQSTHPTVGSCASNPVLDASPGSFTETGAAATLLHGYKITASPAAFTESGQAATLLTARALTASPAVFTETGASANLLAARKLTASAASLALAGQDVAFARGYGIAAAKGDFVQAGQAAYLLAARNLSSAAGSFALAGQEVAFHHGFGMIAANGLFTETGMAANLLAVRLLNAAAGSFTLTGQSASLVAGSTEIVPISRDTRVLRPMIR